MAQIQCSQKELKFQYTEGVENTDLEYSELKKKYEKTLMKLPIKQREVFLMSRVEELKYSEIAERLRISVKAVEKRMKKALEASDFSVTRMPMGEMSKDAFLEWLDEIKENQE